MSAPSNNPKEITSQIANKKIKENIQQSRQRPGRIKKPPTTSFSLIPHRPTYKYFPFYLSPVYSWVYSRAYVCVWICIYVYKQSKDDMALLK